MIIPGLDTEYSSQEVPLAFKVEDLATVAPDLFLYRPKHTGREVGRYVVHRFSYQIQTGWMFCRSLTQSVCGSSAIPLQSTGLPLGPPRFAARMAPRIRPTEVSAQAGMGSG